MQDVLRYASDIRGVAYFGVLIAVALIECVVPRRRPGDTLALRWAGNVILAVLGTIVVRALFPFAGFALAILCSERNWGRDRLGAHQILPSGAAMPITLPRTGVCTADMRIVFMDGRIMEQRNVETCSIREFVWR